jgi:hypothetical protein
MDDFLTKALAERRSLEEALTDLRAKYQRQPSPDLARMIRELEAEVSYRRSQGATTDVRRSRSRELCARSAKGKP